MTLTYADVINALHEFKADVTRLEQSWELRDGLAFSTKGFMILVYNNGDADVVDTTEYGRTFSLTKPTMFSRRVENLFKLAVLVYNKFHDRCASVEKFKKEFCGDNVCDIDVKKKAS